MSALQNKRGVALIAVLWLVSALALIAMGLVRSVRLEIQSVGHDRESATSTALADAAILLALQRIQQPQFSVLKPHQIIATEFEGHSFQISVTALNGLIDLNSAPESLLAALYFHIGEMPDSQAKNLARASLEYRQFLGEARSKRGFAAAEDLLNVPGLGYDVYVKVKDLVTADLQEGGGKVNPLAAPVEVLRVLSGGNLEVALEVVKKRNLGALEIDPAGLNTEFISSSVSRSFVFSTAMNLPSGATFTRNWTVFLGIDPTSRLPWRQLNTRTSVLTPKE